ncbi:MAG: hypothetical protein AVDCRST_MAG37-2807 [uncultured Rubrobacteraceae bacterium]|uniref:Uncharacterized protein n=1 Tax=uncultured Rubrobacteraceae bacterium TaxID=349277 RepID=A0A6J4QX54_9ACTN|nr:MAG: hypothetical protein AVDCRST_MAG37-2807 [uncultured Rubrobacteraceae bacterium]
MLEQEAFSHRSSAFWPNVAYEKRAFSGDRKTQEYREEVTRLEKVSRLDRDP